MTRAELYGSLIGERFGLLVVVRQYAVAARSKNRQWLCVCACGDETTATTAQLRYRAKRSCGCLARLNGIRKLRRHHDVRRAIEKETP